MKKTICLLLCAAFALFGAGCSDKGSNPVSISFPAYQEGQNESNAQIYGTAPPARGTGPGRRRPVLYQGGFLPGRAVHGVHRL